MRTTSLDTRERIVKAFIVNKESQSELARRFLTSQSTVSRILSKWDAKESLLPGTSPGRQKKLSKDSLDFLVEKLSKKNDLTHKELMLLLEEEKSVSVSIRTIGRALEELNLSRKKRQGMTQKEIRK